MRRSYKNKSRKKSKRRQSRKRRGHKIYHMDGRRPPGLSVDVGSYLLRGGGGGSFFQSDHTQNIITSRGKDYLETIRKLRNFMEFSLGIPCHDKFVDELNKILEEINIRFNYYGLRQLLEYLPIKYSCIGEYLTYTAKLFDPPTPFEKISLRTSLLKPSPFQSLIKSIINMNHIGVYHNDLANLKNIVISSDGFDWGIIDWEFASINTYRGTIHSRIRPDINLTTDTYTEYFFSVFEEVRDKKYWDLYQFLFSLYDIYKNDPRNFEYIRTQIILVGNDLPVNAGIRSLGTRTRIQSIGILLRSDYYGSKCLKLFGI